MCPFWCKTIMRHLKMYIIIDSIWHRPIPRQKCKENVMTENVCLWKCFQFDARHVPLIARFMEPTRGPPGSCRPQMVPMWAPWTLLSGVLWMSTAFRFSSFSRWNLRDVYQPSPALSTYFGFVRTYPEKKHFSGTKYIDVSWKKMKEVF